MLLTTLAWISGQLFIPLAPIWRPTVTSRRQPWLNPAGQVKCQCCTRIVVHMTWSRLSVYGTPGFFGAGHPDSGVMTRLPNAKSE
jgi:hypothetical protein